MDRREPDSHSFIVKVWREEAGDQAGRVTWRGHITHVPSGVRRYMQELGVIIDFILPYLEALGVRPRGWLWVRRWLQRRVLRIRRRLERPSDDSPHKGGQT